MQLLCSRTCSPSHALVGPNRTARLRLHAPPPASPRPHAVNEENAALRKAIARRRRRADRGAREGADGPELGLRGALVPVRVPIVWLDTRPLSVAAERHRESSEYRYRRISIQELYRVFSVYFSRVRRGGRRPE